MHLIDSTYRYVSFSLPGMIVSRQNSIERDHTQQQRIFDQETDKPGEQHFEQWKSF